MSGHGRRIGPGWRTAASVVALGTAALLAAGCDEITVVDPGCRGPLPPVGVYSVTGDGEVVLYWTAADEGEAERFVVYRARSENGPYFEIADTRRDWYVDDDVRNGETYFYAVTAVNPCGFESELSRETVFDTPRPEGFGARLFDANGDGWRRSGWDFSGYRSLPWDHADADVYFVISAGTRYLVAADAETDIQDAGYLGFDDMGWAPDGGWSPSGAVEAVPGHVIVVWTRDNHFAKVRVTSTGADTMDFDWAYQVDRGNPELAPRPGRELRTADFGVRRVS